VKNIALAASLSRMFKTGSVSDRFAPRDLWHHCVAVGVCARQMAAAAGMPHADEAFVAGLVHDLGLIVSQQMFPEDVRKVVDTCLDEPQSYCGLEQQVLGADHAALGLSLATRWKFPLPLRAAIARHHEPEGLKDELARSVFAVYLADTTCCAGRYGFWLTAQGQEIGSQALEVVGLTRDQVDAVAGDLPELVEEAERVFSE
jgi:putative nucleotidyltransferase with HDIG domain